MVSLARVSARMLVILVGIVLLAACTMPFSAERQYISGVFDHARRTVATLNTLQQLMSDPRPEDAAWVGQSTDQISTLRRLIDEARAMDPPPRFAGFHTSYLEAMASLEQAISPLEQVVAVGNNEALQQVRQALEQGRSTINELRERITRLSEQQ